jgi:hypothetical protein
MKLAYGLMSLLLLPSAALADDAHLYGGMECQTTAPSVISYGRKLSNASYDSLFECTVLKDSGDYNIDLPDTHLWALDLSTTSSVNCTIWSAYMSGSTLLVWTGTSVYPSSAGTPSTFSSASPQKLTFTGYLGNVSASSYSNWYQLTCWVPALSSSGQSGVSSYLVDENT